MRFRWPWERDKRAENPPPFSSVEEQDAMRRDIGQIKSVNRHILAKAIKDHWLGKEEAEAIRAIQMDVGEEPNGGANSRAPD